MIIKKIRIIFYLIFVISSFIIYSSSGMTLFNSNRSVNMCIVDSEDALIAIPNEIKLDLSFKKQIINYYKTEIIEQETEELNEKGEKISIPILNKIYTTQEEIISFEDITDNFTIKNNMYDPITLKQFSSEIFKINGDKFTISPGNNADFKIDLKDKYKKEENLKEFIINNNNDKFEIELLFIWNNGSSVIYKNIILEHIDIVEEITEKEDN